MKYQPSDASLAAMRTAAESASPSKITIPVTERFKAIAKEIADHTIGRVSSKETWYLRDVARGHYQTADFARIALGARRSPFPADQRELLDYVRTLIQAKPQTVLPFERALLRKAIEEAEANAAIERARFQETPESLAAAKAEVRDDIAAMQDLERSIDAKLAALSA